MQARTTQHTSVSNSTTTTPTALHLGVLQLKTLQGRSQSTTTTASLGTNIIKALNKQSQQHSYDHLITTRTKRPAASAMLVHLSQHHLSLIRKYFLEYCSAHLSIMVNKFIMKTYLHNLGLVMTSLMTLVIGCFVSRALLLTNTLDSLTLFDLKISFGMSNQAFDLRILHLDQTRVFHEKREHESGNI